MILNIQDDILKLHALGLLDRLLADKTTKRHIMWATDAYGELGPHYERNEEILPELITGSSASVIKTRARKALEQQSERTRQRGEVFTPLKICRKMCDHAHETLSGKSDWKKYVDSRTLEITCGEAPFLVSRYDVETGEVIPVSERIGLLDRKLQMVGENTQAEEDWFHWALRAFHATYAYEFQGDNLLISRVNLLMTFEEYLWERWRRKPTPDEYQRLVNVVVWNVWQMDGLTKTVPYATAEEAFQQFDLFGLFDDESDSSEENTQPHCLIYNWLGKGSAEFAALPTRGKRAMKFDFVIGNPPYQDETVGEQKTFAPPIYHLFLEEAYKVGDRVELIHPARFLFNAGSTPKAWNQKMLNDPHLKVLFHEQDSSKVFQNTDIKGGVAVTYRSTKESFGAIETYTAFPELNTILKKVRTHAGFSPFSQIVITRTAYRLTDFMHKEHPEALSMLSDGHPYDMSTNIFERLPQLFFNVVPEDGYKYIQIYGRENNERSYKFIRAGYVNNVSNLYKWKIFVPAANGSGAIGEVLTTPVIGQPVIGQPVIGHTESFISIGAFETEQEAVSTLKYIKSKFARAMLGILKITQHNPPEKWKYVPLQDFTSRSDIDWTKSIPEIDQQLYAKYGLSQEEIDFIESHVKEME